MRSMIRNKTAFYYALFDHKEEMLDEYGNKSGEYKIIYSKPRLHRDNISTEQGEIQSRQFGENVIYDRVIVSCDKNLPIDEYSILWVDTPPVINEDGSTNTPHDYIVKKVAKSLSVVSIAISKVNVRHG